MFIICIARKVYFNYFSITVHSLVHCLVHVYFQWRANWAVLWVDSIKKEQCKTQWPTVSTWYILVQIHQHINTCFKILFLWCYLFPACSLKLLSTRYSYNKSLLSLTIKANIMVMAHATTIAMYSICLLITRVVCRLI